MDKISNKYIKRKSVANTYRLALRSHEGFNVKKVDNAIIDRWSIVALQYIKNLAWDINKYSVKTL
ncbi:MAG: hypothetical protein ACUZ8O_05250 [Candidatus Anammoxibacter sp.]